MTFTVRRRTGPNLPGAGHQVEIQTFIEHLREAHMHRPSVYKLWVLLGFISIVFIAPGVLASENLTEAGQTSFSREQTLVIGKVTEDPKKIYKKLKPIASYAAGHMADLGIRKVEVLFAQDNAMMIRYLRQGKVDWITETPFSALIFVEKADAEILLRRWKKGVAQYHTIFFTRKDHAIESLADLKGKTIAFEDPGSTTAFLLPAATLISNGLSLVQFETPRDRPPADKVGFIFARNEVNAPTWVYKNMVDAGAFSNLDWEDSDRMIESIKSKMKIFHRTVNIPRGLELVRKDLRTDIKSRLKAVLLNCHKDPEAKSALKAYKKTTRFDALDAQIQNNLEWIQSLSRIVQSELM